MSLKVAGQVSVDLRSKLASGWLPYHFVWGVWLLSLGVALFSLRQYSYHVSDADGMTSWQEDADHHQQGQTSRHIQNSAPISATRSIVPTVEAPITVSQEIRYHMPEAGEVWLVWGVNGWQTLPEKAWPAGTVIRDDLMHTPMHDEGGVFTAVLRVPAQATIEYGFLITRSYDGTAIEKTWEGGVTPIRAPDAGVIDVHSRRTLPRNPLSAFISDLRFHRGAMLRLAVSFFLVFVALIVWATWSRAILVHQLTEVDRTLFNVVLAAASFKVILLLIAYLSLASFDTTNPDLVLFQPADVSSLLTAFSRGDVQWYMSIAQEGYEARPFSADQQANWAFYPLWPMVLRLSAYLPIGMVTWGILVANGLSILAIAGIYRLVLLDFDREVAALTALLAAAFPGAYFFMRPGPEALFLLLTVFSLYAARRRRWLLAGGLGALATVTRLQGILLLLPLLYLYYHRYKTAGRHRLTAVAFFLIPAALLLHMTRLYFLTGNFSANLEVQAAWDHHLSYPFAAMVRFLSAPAVVDYYGWNLAPVSFLFVFLATVVALEGLRQKGFPRDLLLFMISSLLVVVSRDNLNASLRYLSLIFPLFLILVLGLQKRQIMIALLFFFFIAIQVFYVVAFALGVNWAVT